jgi:hypothetical protein
MSRDLDRENAILLAELGSEQGHQRYKWCFSENLYMPLRKGNEYDYRANEAGIIEAHYVYEMRKICPQLTRQWVVCRWQAPMQVLENPLTGAPEVRYLDEDSFKRLYGKHIDYPRNGYYAPTNVELDPDIKPWDTNEQGESLTKHIIGLLRQQAHKTFADHMQDGADIIARREAAYDHMLDEKIGDIAQTMSFLHTPGTANGPISYPVVVKNG